MATLHSANPCSPTQRTHGCAWLFAIAGILLATVSGAQTPSRPPAQPKPAAAATDDPEHITLELSSKTWKGDLDGMIQRRGIRVLVPYSKTFYFVDFGTQRGISYEMMHAFEAAVNKSHKLTKLRFNAVFIPVSRDQLIPMLLAGRGDVVAANLTITPQRSSQVDFTIPIAEGVKEIVVTSPDAPALASVDDLSGKEIFVQRSSSYYENLVALNAGLKQRGKLPIRLRDAPATFESEDVLEMVNAGLVKYTVVDRYLATFWKQIYTQMKVREDLVIHDHGDIAFAIRKGSPQLKAELDTFLKANKRGTTFGNVVMKKYLQDTRWAKNATSAAEMKKFAQLGEMFRKYGDQYRIDWLLMAAQGYQESGLDQKVKSSVGAVGVMQVMPATGKDMKVGDIHQIDANIHAGVKYIRFMMDQYYKDEPMDDLNKALFAFASYNAGPARIRGLRSVAKERGLDPNKWFNNVERIAADKIGRETVQYVSNIYKYYVAYSLASEQIRLDRERKAAGAKTAASW